MLERELCAHSRICWTSSLLKLCSFKIIIVISHPYQPTLFQCLGGQNYLFCKEDNLWGYHQLKLAKDSSKVTAIITLWGVHRFLACPFGISTASGEYQARILSLMAAFNVRLKPSKYFFGMTSIDFLGHIFDVHCTLFHLLIPV